MLILFFITMSSYQRTSQLLLRTYHCFLPPSSALVSILCPLCIVLTTHPNSWRRRSTRRLWLRSVRIHRPDGESISMSSHYLKIAGFQHELDSPFLITTVCFRCELDDGMERNLYVGQVVLRKIMEVGIAMTSTVKWRPQRG